MKVNMKGLINRLDDLRERLNELFDKLEELDDLDYEMAVEDVQQYFLAGDTFNLSIAISVLEQADKLDKALEIIKKKPQIEITHIQWGKIETYDEYLKMAMEWDLGYGDMILTQEEFDLLKEVLL